MLRSLMRCAVLGIVLTLGLARADAGLIDTAGLDRVVAASSHIVLARWDAQEGLVPERWFRGTWPEGPLQLPWTPRVLADATRTGRLEVRPALVARRTPRAAADRVLLCLEEHLGRLHVTGYRRRGPGFAAHAAVRILDADDQVFRFQQVMNPGPPTAVPDTPASWPAFAAHLGQLVDDLPYTPSPHPVQLPTLAGPERERLLGLLGHRVDLYQGGWHVQYAGWHGASPDRDGIEALAGELDALIRSTPSPAAALHALDALTLLSRRTREGFAHQPTVRRIALAATADVPPHDVRTWLLDEIEHGRGDTDWVLLARMAATLDEATYEQALQRLEAWVERQGYNEGVDVAWALRELGEGDRAEAAAARRETREAGDATAK